MWKTTAAKGVTRPWVAQFLLDAHVRMPGYLTVLCFPHSPTAKADYSRTRLPLQHRGWSKCFGVKILALLIAFWVAMGQSLNPYVRLICQMEIFKRPTLKGLEWELNKGEKDGDTKGRGGNEWQLKQEVGLTATARHADGPRVGVRRELRDSLGALVPFPQVILIYMPLTSVAQITTLNTILLSVFVFF